MYVMIQSAVDKLTYGIISAACHTYRLCGHCKNRSETETARLFWCLELIVDEDR